MGLRANPPLKPRVSVPRLSKQISLPFWRRSAWRTTRRRVEGLMGERWRMAFIALTAVVVALAIASAIFSPSGPAPSQGEALYTPSATPSPSPSPSPTRTFTLPPTPTATPTSTPRATDTPSPRPKPSPTFTSYVVKTGDTLSAIARRFGVTLQAILAANPDITDPRHIRAGQIILIPPPGWSPSPSPG